MQEFLGGSAGSIAVGIIVSVLPLVISLTLPRKKTIMYGMAIHMWVGKMLMQTGNTISNGKGMHKVIVAIRTTFVDFSFGIYLASKKLSKEDINVMIDKHIKGR